MASDGGGASPPAAPPSLYDQLELDHTASPDDIRRQYRRLALLYHPDRAGASGEARMKAINEAYAVLNDPRRRDAYDKFGLRGLDYVDNPYAGPVVDQFGMHAVMTLLSFTSVCFLASAIALLATIASKVDGQMNWSWTATLFPMWIVLAVITLLTIVYIGALIRSIIVDSQEASVRNFLPLLPFLCFISTPIMLAIALDRPGSIPWLVVVAPYMLVQLIAFIMTIANSRTEDVRQALAQQGLTNISTRDIRLLMIESALLYVYIFAFIALLGVWQDFHPIRLNAWVVSIPLFVAAASAYAKSILWVKLLIQNERMTVGQAICNLTTQLILFALPIVTIALVDARIEGSVKISLAECFAPLFVLFSGFLLVAAWSTLAFACHTKHALDEAAGASEDDAGVHHQFDMGRSTSHSGGASEGPGSGPPSSPPDRSGGAAASAPTTDYHDASASLQSSDAA